MNKEIKSVIELRMKRIPFSVIGRILNRRPKYLHRLYRDFLLYQTGGRDYTRLMARIRDDFRCQKCGKQWKTGQRQLDVHHIDGFCGKKTKKYDRVEELKSLLVLCHRCHLNLDEVREKMRNGKNKIRG